MSPQRTGSHERPCSKTSGGRPPADGDLPGRLPLLRQLFEACLILVLWLGLQSAAAAREAEPPPTAAGDLQMIGKLYCSLKRTVILPFAAEITALTVSPGQAVHMGEVLGHYRLTPEAQQAVRRRLTPPRLPELEARLAQVERDLAAATTRLRTAQALLREQLGSREGMREAERTVQALQRTRNALALSIQEERLLAQEERRLVSRQLGVTVPAAATPRTGVLTAPISGHVLWLHPELRVGAELKGGEPVLHVGVLDPMVVQVRVHERDLPYLTPGVEAKVTVESVGQQTFSARLSRLPWSSPAPLEQPAYFEVEFLLPNPGLVLKEGMKATLFLPKP